MIFHISEINVNLEIYALKFKKLLYLNASTFFG